MRWADSDIIILYSLFVPGLFLFIIEVCHTTACDGANVPNLWPVFVLLSPEVVGKVPNVLLARDITVSQYVGHGVLYFACVAFCTLFKLWYEGPVVTTLVGFVQSFP